MPTLSKTQRYVYILLALILSVYILIQARTILVPMVFAILLMITLLPLHKAWLPVVHYKILSVILTLLTILIPFGLVIYYFSLQIGEVSQSLPSIGDNIEAGINEILAWLAEKKIVRTTDVKQWFQDNFSTFILKPLDILQVGLAESTKTLTSLILTLMYVIFLLYYEKGLKRWAMMLVPELHQSEWRDILKEIQRLVQKYLVGMLMVVAVLAILNSIGLLVIGIEYAFFWGFLAGFLALIPYIGTFLGGILPFLFAIASTGTWYEPALVFGLFVLVQFLEGNFITPNIVGNQVSINPLAAILAIIVGATIWGLAGVVLAIPMAAIIRVSCSRIPALQPIAYLMGTEISK